MINHLVNQRYEVLEKVGESPFFAVYKARDRVSNRIVALKAVQPPYASDSGFLEALKAGCAASANLSHANITAVQEYGIEEGTPYFITEFVRGINLKERIRRIAPFTLSVAVDFACAITEALNYAHSVGQSHGDLRPQNIIISPEGAVKVTDFGAQRAIARSAQAQRDKLLRAAPYHAPELSTTQPGSVSGDIYAMGAILYEMLTGAPLYSGESAEAIAEQQAFAAIPSPRALNPGIPRSIEGIILKCLQKKPEERYRNAADLLNDLKSVRDALRFGKPLSWSPIEFEKLAAASAVPIAAGGGASAIPVATPPVRRASEPVAEVAASSMPIPMPAASNRLRAEDGRVSIYLKIAIGAVTVIIITCLILFVAVWSTMWVAPKPITVPQMVGKPIDEVRAMANDLKVILKEHPEFSDKPRYIVYKTDQVRGAQIRPGHVINIWYSNGAEYVYVPNVTNLPKEEAEKRLLDTGLKVGKETPEYSNRVPINNIVRQNVTYKKRVMNGTVVDLVFSDGPKPDYASPDTDTGQKPDITPNTNGTDTPGTTGTDTTGSSPANSTNPTGANPGNPPADGTPPPGTNNTDSASDIASPDEPQTFDRKISIPSDGLGSRSVRIEYRDSHGWQTVIEEQHSEGDKIPLTFDYYGKNITLRIYYDGKVRWERTFDPQQKGRVQ